MAKNNRNRRPLELNRDTKGLQKSTQKVAESPKPSIRPVSRGKQRYQLLSDIKTEQDAYEAQIAEEQEKAEKKSMWSTIGGVLGAAAGVALAPAVLGIAGVAALTGTAGAIVTGVGTGLMAGAGSATVGRWGKEGAEKGALGTKKAKSKDIKVDKFFNKQAQEATDTFKDYDRSIDENIKNQAYVSGALAGLQASGAFKAAGKAVKKGLGLGGSEAAVFDPSLVTRADIGGKGQELAYGTTKGAASASQLAEGSQVAIPLSEGVEVTAATGAVEKVAASSIADTGTSYNLADAYGRTTYKDPTSVFGNLSNKTLYQNLKQQAMGQAINYGASSIFTPYKSKYQTPSIGEIESPYNR